MQYTNICQNITTFEKRGMGGVSLSILQSFSPSKMRVNIRKIIIGYENCAPRPVARAKFLRSTRHNHNKDPTKC